MNGSALNHFNGSQQPIVRVKLHTECFYKDKTENNEECFRPGVFILQHQHLCEPTMHVNPDNLESAAMNNSEEIITVKNNSIPTISFGATTTNFHHEIENFQNHHDVERLPAFEYCTKENRLCSKHGQKYHYCVAEYFQDKLDNEFLESASKICYFLLKK